MEVYQSIIVLICLGGFGMSCYYSGRRVGIAGAVDYYMNLNQEKGE